MLLAGTFLYPGLKAGVRTRITRKAQSGPIVKGTVHPKIKIKMSLFQ